MFAVEEPLEGERFKKLFNREIHEIREKMSWVLFAKV
jgi:hypothetical protein